MLTEKDLELINAIRAGDYAQCKTLIESEPNANVNAQDEQGWTPLHHLVSVSGQHLLTAYRIYQLLRQKGASLEIKNQAGQKPLEVKNFNSRALPIFEATPLPWPGLNIEKCFEVPIRLVEEHNGAGFDYRQLPCDWWDHWLTEKLDTQQSLSSDYSRVIQGALIYVLAESPRTLQAQEMYRGNYLYVPSESKLIWIEATVEANAHLVCDHSDKLRSFAEKFAPYWQSKVRRLGEVKQGDECPVPLVMALTADDLIEVIQKTTGYVLSSDYEPNTQLRADLQKLYALHMDLLAKKLSEDEKQQLRESVVSGIVGCAGGVGNRIGTVLQNVLGVQEFIDFLYMTRVAMVSELVAQDPLAGGVRGQAPETHTRNSFFTVASVSVGVLPENCLDPHSGGVEVAQVLSGVWSLFSSKFRLYPLARALAEQFKSRLYTMKVPYIGRSSEGYPTSDWTDQLKKCCFSREMLSSFEVSASGDSTESLDPVIEAFAHVLLEGDEKDNPDEYSLLSSLFEMDPDTFVVSDIHWNRLKIWMQLLLQKKGYFTQTFTLIPGTEPTKERPYALWVSEPQDVIDCLADAELPFQVYKDFLQAYVRHAPEKVDGAFLNQLFLQAVEQRQARVCTYLGSEWLGHFQHDVNQLVRHQPTISPEILKPALDFYRGLKFEKMIEPPRLKTPEAEQQERKRAADLEDMPKPYAIPYINQQWFADLTPLMMAIKIGDLALAKQLVAEGASIRMTNSRGCTILHVLAYFSKSHTPAVNTALLAQLSAWGVDPLANSENGYWPSDFATNQNFRAQLLQQELRVALQRQDAKSIDLAIHKGAAVNLCAPQAPAEPPVLKQQQAAADQQARIHAREREERLAQLAEQRAEISETVNAWAELQYLAQGVSLCGVAMPESATPVARLVALLLKVEDLQRYSLQGLTNEKLTAAEQEQVTAIVARLPPDIGSELTQTVVTEVMRVFAADPEKCAKLPATLEVQIPGSPVFVTRVEGATGKALSIVGYRQELLVAEEANRHYSPRVLQAELLKRFLLEGKALERFVALRFQAKTGVLFKEAPMEALENFLAEEQQRWAELKIRSFGDLHTCYQEGQLGDAGAFAALFARLADLEKELVKACKIDRFEVQQTFFKVKNAYERAIHQQVQQELHHREVKIDAALESSANPLRELEQRVNRAKQDVLMAHNALTVAQQEVQQQSAQVEQLNQSHQQLQQQVSEKTEEIANKRRDLVVLLSTRQQEEKTAEEAYQAAKSALAQGAVDVQKTAEQTQALDNEIARLGQEITRLNSEITRLRSEQQGIENEIATCNTRKEREIQKQAEQQAQKTRLEASLVWVKKVQAAIMQPSVLQDVDKVQRLHSAIAHLTQTDWKSVWEEKVEPILNIPALAEIPDGLCDAIRTSIKEVLPAEAEALKQHYDAASKTLTLSGYNVSWQVAWELVNHFIDHLLTANGLKRGDDDSIHVVGDGKGLVIEQLANPLQELIREWLYTHRKSKKADHVSLGGKEWEALKSRDQAAKELLEDCGLTGSQLLSRCLESIEIIAGHHIVIENRFDRIILPGVDLVLKAGGDVMMPAHLQIDTSTPDAAAFVGDRVQALNGSVYRRVSEKSNGSPGEDGASGLAGRSAGDIRIEANRGIIHHLDSLSCNTNGGNGANGQKGGDGDAGYEGVTVGLADPIHPDEISEYDFSSFGRGARSVGGSVLKALRWLGGGGFNEETTTIGVGRQSGVNADGSENKAEQSGNGGAGGRRGAGGEAGRAGLMSFSDSQVEWDSERQQPESGTGLGTGLVERFKAITGRVGQPCETLAKGGEAGPAGFIGQSKFHGLEFEGWWLGKHLEERVRSGHYDPEHLRREIARLCKTFWATGKTLGSFTPHNNTMSSEHAVVGYYQELPGEQKTAMRSSHEYSRGADGESLNEQIAEQTAEGKTNQKTHSAREQTYREQLAKKVQTASVLDKTAALSTQVEQAVKTCNETLATIAAEIQTLDSELSECAQALEQKQQQVANTVAEQVATEQRHQSKQMERASVMQVYRQQLEAASEQGVALERATGALNEAMNARIQTGAELDSYGWMAEQWQAQGARAEQISTALQREAAMQLQAAQQSEAQMQSAVRTAENHLQALEGELNEQLAEQERLRADKARMQQAHNTTRKTIERVTETAQIGMDPGRTPMPSVGKPKAALVMLEGKIELKKERDETPFNQIKKKLQSNLPVLRRFEVALARAGQAPEGEPPYTVGRVKAYQTAFCQFLEDRLAEEKGLDSKEHAQFFAFYAERLPAVVDDTIEVGAPLTTLETALQVPPSATLDERVLNLSWSLLMILKKLEEQTAEARACQSDYTRLQGSIQALAPHIAVAQNPMHPLSEIIAQLRLVWQKSVNAVVLPNIVKQVYANQWKDALSTFKTLILPTLTLWSEQPDSCGNVLQQLQTWNVAFGENGISPDQALSLWEALDWSQQPMATEECILGQWLAGHIDPFSLDTDVSSLTKAEVYWQRFAKLHGGNSEKALQRWIQHSMNQKEQVLARLEPTWPAAEGRAALVTVMQALKQWEMLQECGDRETALKRLKALYQALEPLVNGEPPAQAKQAIQDLQVQWLQEVKVQLQTLFNTVAEVKTEEPKPPLLDFIDRLSGFNEESQRQKALLALYYSVQFGPSEDRKLLMTAAQSLQQALAGQLPEATRPHYQALLGLINMQCQALATAQVIAKLNELQIAVAKQQKKFAEIPTLLQAYAVVEKEGESSAKRKGRRALWSYWLRELMANAKPYESLKTVEALRRAFNQLGLEKARAQQWFVLRGDPNAWWVQESGKLQTLLNQKEPVTSEDQLLSQWLSLVNSFSSQLAQGVWPECAEDFLVASERFVLSFAFADTQLQWDLSQQQKMLVEAASIFRALRNNDVPTASWRTGILKIEQLSDWLEISAYERQNYHDITALITRSQALSERQQHEAVLLRLRQDLPAQLAEQLPALLQEANASERLDSLAQVLTVDAFMANPKQVKDDCESLMAAWPKAAKADEKETSRDSDSPVVLQQSLLALSHEGQALYWQNRIQPLFDKMKSRLETEVPAVAKEGAYWKQAWDSVFDNPSYQDSEVGYASLLRQLDGFEGTTKLKEGLYTVLAFKAVILSSYSVAVNEGHENLWLLMMDRLLTGHAAGLVLPAMTAILKHWHQVMDPIPLLQGLASAETATWENQVLALVIMQELQSVQPMAADTEILLTTELTDIVFHTVNGGQLLQTLLNRLQVLNEEEEGVAPGLAEKVLKQLRYLKTIGAHESEVFIHSLQTLPWIHWDQALRRYEITSKLGLQSGEALVDQILGVASLAPKQAEAWWCLLTEPTPIDRSTLERLQALITQRQVILDESLITELQKDPGRVRWEATFAERQSAHTARLNDDVDLTLPELIQTMLQEGNENPELQRFLTTAEGQSECTFERIIRLARERQISLYGGQEAGVVQNNIKTYLKACQASQAFLPVDDEEALIQWLATLLQGVHAQTGKTIRDTQLLALLCFIKGLSSGQGCLGNIFTGEGKSLITQLFALTCAMKGRRVDVLTSSPSLADRDAKEAKAVLSYFGINVSNNCDLEATKNLTERKVRYEAHIVYGDIGSFQRDRLLTDSMGQEICPDRPGYVVIDEADSLLIDGADRVLYLSHPMDDLLHLRPLFELSWSAVLGKDMTQISEWNIHTIEAAMRKAIADRVIDLPNAEAIQKLVDRKLTLWIRNAFVAKSLPRDRSYSVMDKGDGQVEVVINDLPTGVEQLNAQWSNGLHIFLQLRYSQALSQESLRAIYVSNVSYLQEYARAGVLFGMSGTLGQEAEQNVYRECFKMDSFRVPRFKPDHYQQREATPIVGSYAAWLEQLKSATDQCMRLEQGVGDLSGLKEEVTQAVQEEARLRADYQQAKDAVKKVQEERQALEKGRGDALNNLVQMLTLNQNRGEMKDLVDRLERNCAEKDQELAQRQAALERAEKAYREVKGRRETLDVKLSGRRGQPVLIICKDKADVKAVEESLRRHYAERLGTQPPSVRLKVYDSYVDHFELETEGLEPGDIIVATNIAGRGTDLPLNPTLVKKAAENPLGEEGKGLHVILGYMPSNVRTELQAFYRAARKGEPGSGQFVVWDERAVQEGVSISIGQLQAERDALEQKRLHAVIAQQIPAKELGERLSRDYKVFESEICAELKKQGVVGYCFDAQKAALRTHWALWEDEFSPAIEATSKTGDADIWQAFSDWKEHIRTLLNHSSERLVNLPMQLFQLGKQHYDAKNYAEAIRCFDQSIAQEPVFSEFSYYYRGAAKLANDRSAEAKRSAKKDFKQAIRKFKKRIEERQTANQINHFNRERLSHAGEGLVMDRLTRRNNDEIALMTQHMQACYQVVGSELTPAVFRCEGVDEKAAQAIFDHLRQTMRDQIKDYRISRKVKLEGGVLQYQQHNIRLPEEFSAQHSRIIDILRETRERGEGHEARVLSPSAFEGLFNEQKEDEKKKQSQQLWAFLEAQGVVKQPKLYRPELTTSKARIDQAMADLKKAVDRHTDQVAEAADLKRAISEEEWRRLDSAQRVSCSPQRASAGISATPLLSAAERQQWADEIKRKKEVDQLLSAISTSLNQRVGSLHTLPQVTLEGRKIEELFVGQYLPEWITQYMQGACRDVLNLVEAKEDAGFNWDAFCCALIGVAQIVAGTMISVCFPAAAALGEMLISEGIGDISFAVKGMINGDFSWEAYGEYKVQSLVLSFATMGVGVALNGVKALKSGPEGLNLMKQLTSRISSAAVDVAFDVAGSMAISQLSSAIASQLMKLFRSEFKEQVESALAGPLAKIQEHLTALMMKNGAQQTEEAFAHSINHAYQQLAQQQIMSKALDMVQQISGKVAKMGGGKSAAWNTITQIAGAVSEIFHNTRYVRLIASMVANVTEVFSAVQQEIAASHERVKNRENKDAMTREAAEQKVKQLKDQLVNKLVEQIEQGVQRILNQVGNETMGGFVFKPLQQGCHEKIQEFCHEHFVETVNLPDYVGLNLTNEEKPYFVPGSSPFKSAEQMDWETAKEILQQQTTKPVIETPQGPKTLAAVEKALEKKQAEASQGEVEVERAVVDAKDAQENSSNPRKPRKPKMVLKKQREREKKKGHTSAKAHLVKDEMGEDRFEKLLNEGMEGMYERAPGGGCQGSTCRPTESDDSPQSDFRASNLALLPALSEGEAEMSVDDNGVMHSREGQHAFRQLCMRNPNIDFKSLDAHTLEAAVTHEVEQQRTFKALTTLRYDGPSIGPAAPPSEADPAHFNGSISSNGVSKGGSIQGGIEGSLENEISLLSEDFGKGISYIEEKRKDGSFIGGAQLELKLKSALSWSKEGKTLSASQSVGLSGDINYVKIKTNVPNSMNLEAVARSSAKAEAAVKVVKWREVDVSLEAGACAWEQNVDVKLPPVCFESMKRCMQVTLHKGVCLGGYKVGYQLHVRPGSFNTETFIPLEAVPVSVKLGVTVSETDYKKGPDPHP